MFNLSFLNAGILFVTLATVIPLLIHLFSKQKPQKVYFSSLKFIKESLKERQKQIKIKNLLIIIIRMLIILLTILAIARPAVKTSLQKSKQSHNETAVAIIIDNSISMDYLVDNETEFEKAKKIFNEINGLLTDKDITLVLSRDSQWNQLNSRLIYGKAGKESLSSLSISYLPLSLNECISEANRFLSESNYLNKEIYVISDFQKEEKINKSDIPVFIIPTSQTKTRVNLSIKNPSIIASHKNIYEKEIEFTIKNHSNDEQNDIIYKIFLNGNPVSEKMISLFGNQEKTETQSLSNSVPGWNEGWIEIKNEVMLPDNRVYFSYYIESSPRIALFSDHTLNSSFNVVLDLFKGKTGKVEQVNPSGFSSEDLDKYTFFIINLNHFDEKLKQLLLQMEDKNKKALILLNSNLTSEDYQLIQEIVSGQVQIIKGSEKTGAISFINNHHPILKLFDINTLKLININPVVKIQNSTSGNVLLQSDQSPLLTDNHHLLLNINLDKENGNFILSPAFPVLFFRIFQYMSNVEFSDIFKPVGSMLEINEGTVSISKDKKFSINNGRYQFTEPGIYRVQDRDKGEKSLSINLGNYEESDYTRWDTHNKNNINFLDDKWKNEILRSRLGLEIWKYLLVLVFILVGFEMYIIKREENRNKQ